MNLWPVISRTIVITGFVAVMMILVEYVNVSTRGRWRQALSGSRWRQYVVAALLGATPGCLGAFVVATLFMHRTVSVGAVVACMVATSGDEAFVMFALFPETAALLTGLLALIGVVAGACTDLFIRRQHRLGCAVLVVHHEDDVCRCFDRGLILPQLRCPTPVRALLLTGSAMFLAAILAGAVGPVSWGWVRISLLGVVSLTLFVVATAPDHFLDEHLWRHVACKHVPRVFLWTGGAMLLIAFVDSLVGVESLVRSNAWIMLLFAGLLGLVPESGPHLVLVTLFDHGAIPFSVLLASSIVQDGHGMLPILAHSRRDFVTIKAINLLAGLLVGAAILSLGG